MTVTSKLHPGNQQAKYLDQRSFIYKTNIHTRDRLLHLDSNVVSNNYKLRNASSLAPNKQKVTKAKTKSKT